MSSVSSVSSSVNSVSRLNLLNLLNLLYMCVCVCIYIYIYIYIESGSREGVCAYLYKWNTSIASITWMREVHRRRGEQRGGRVGGEGFRRRRRTTRRNCCYCFGGTGMFCWGVDVLPELEELVLCCSS